MKYVCSKCPYSAMCLAVGYHQMARMLDILDLKLSDASYVEHIKHLTVGFSGRIPVDVPENCPEVLRIQGLLAKVEKV